MTPSSPQESCYIHTYHCKQKSIRVETVGKQAPSEKIKIFMAYVQLKKRVSKKVARMIKKNKRCMQKYQVIRKKKEKKKSASNLE